MNLHRISMYEFIIEVYSRIGTSPERLEHKTGTGGTNLRTHWKKWPGLSAVNLGDDADTTAAIYGQIAGAYYGVDGIPEEWLGKLAGLELIEGMAAALYKNSRSI